MARRVTANEARAKILMLLDQVEAGQEVEITRHGTTIARLVPAAGPHALRARFVGVAMTSGPAEDLFATGAW